MKILKNGAANRVVMVDRSQEAHEATVALLGLLALGKREREQGRFRPAAEVFTALDKDD